MRAFWKDIAFSFRLLTRSPGVSLIAIAIAALGIGLTTSMFMVVNGVVLKGLPYKNGDQLMHIRNSNRVRDFDDAELPVRYISALRKRDTGFTSIAGHSHLNTVVISGDGPPERYSLNYVTANFHRTLQVEPLLGPGFQDGDDRYGAARKIMISHRIWQIRYGGDPDILGQVILANGEMTEVVGVMPPGFRFPNDEETWLPAAIDWQASPNEETEGWTWMEVFGRLKPEVSADVATTAVRGHLLRMRKENPIFWSDQEGRFDDLVHTVTPFSEEFLKPEAKRSAYSMLGAAVLILLISCGNVANLLLARFVKRGKELTVRRALGAGRFGLARLIMTEAFLVSLIGSLFGLALMLIGMKYIRARMLEVDFSSNRPATAALNLPEWVEFGVDARVLAFAVGVVVFSGLASGIFPAVRAFRTDIARELNDESRGASGRSVRDLSRLLVIGQIALTATLLVGLGLMMRTVYRLNTVDINLDPRNILTMRIALDEKTFAEAPHAAVDTYQKFLDILEMHPGVAYAATAKRMPLAREYSTRYSVEGTDYPKGSTFPLARNNTVSSNYLRTLGVSLFRGRWFDRTDTLEKGGVTVINSLLAETAWPGEDPVGKRIGVHSGQPNWREEAIWHTVVGIAPDLKMEGLGAKDGPAPGMYFPLYQFGANPNRYLRSLRVNFLLIKARSNPSALLPFVREELSKVDPHAPIYWPKTFEDFLEEQLALFTLAATLFKVFGLCGLFLAAVGLYGVMSYSVAQRTREIGIRTALGANRRAIFLLIARNGALQVAIGLILGIILAAFMARSLNAVLYDISPHDSVTYIVVIFVLCAVSILACFLPARRAANLEPVEALRAE